MTAQLIVGVVVDLFHGWLPLLFAMAVAFAAAAVRGYAGFGLSALIVASMSLVLPPVEIVPCVVLLEVVASLRMLPRLWRQVDGRGLTLLLAGALVGTPAGVTMLAHVPATPMRVVISMVILAMSALVWRGLKLGRPAKPVETVALGGFSGLVNGATSVGGLPVVLFFLATATAVETARATVVAYLFAVGLVTVAAAVYQELFTTDVVLRTFVFLVPVLLGLALGQHRFLATRPESLRRFILLLLMFLAVAGLARAAYDL